MCVSVCVCVYVCVYTHKIHKLYIVHSQYESCNQIVFGFLLFATISRRFRKNNYKCIT